MYYYSSQTLIDEQVVAALWSYAGVAAEFVMHLDASWELLDWISLGVAARASYCAGVCIVGSADAIVGQSSNSVLGLWSSPILSIF